MKTLSKYILTILIIFCSFGLFANGPAIINDSDGFTNVRNGPGMDFKVIDTLFAEDFFYFQFTDNSEWAKVTAWKGRQIEGFIHKSRIQEVESLNNETQKELITKILNRQRTLARDFRAAWKSKDSLAYRKTVRKLENYNDTKYNPILEIIPKYFCTTNDIEVIELFFTTMWVDKGSANEMPSFSIGDCFICEPKLIIKQLAEIKDKEQKKQILDHIEWGLLNHFNADENGYSDNKEFKNLIEKIKEERKKNSP